MRKSKKQDVLDIIKKISNKYNTEVSLIEPLVFKGILNLPVYKSNIVSRLIKTDSKQNPINLSVISGNNLKIASFLENGQSRVHFSDKVGDNSSYSIVLTNRELDIIKNVNKLLMESIDLKTLVDNSLLFIDKDDLNFFSKFLNNDFFKMLKDISDGRESNSTNELQNLISSRFKNMNYRLGLKAISSFNYFRNFSEYEDDFYTNSKEYFEIFRYEQEIKLGVLVLSKSEEELMNEPIVKDIFNNIQKDFPEYFYDRDIGLYESTIDDNDLRLDTISAFDYNRDNLLISPKIDGLPAMDYALGLFSHPHLDRVSEDINSIRFIGENIFYKDYYLYLRNIKTDGGLYAYEINNYIFNPELKKEVIYGVLDKCLEYVNNKKSILDISDYDRNIIGFDFSISTYIKDKIGNYPDIILINSKSSIKKEREIASSILYDTNYAMAKNRLEITNKDFKAKLKNLI